MASPKPLPQRLPLKAIAKAPAPAPASKGQSIKASFTLFPTDSARVEEIAMALAKRGRRITASHAIRLALRSVKIDENKMIALLDEMADEDGRSRSFAKGK